LVPRKPAADSTTAPCSLQEGLPSHLGNASVVAVVHPLDGEAGDGAAVDGTHGVDCRLR